MRKKIASRFLNTNFFVSFAKLDSGMLYDQTIRTKIPRKKIFPKYITFWVELGFKMKE